MDQKTDFNSISWTLRVKLLRDNIQNYYRNIYSSLLSSVVKQPKKRNEEVTVENAANAATEAIKSSSLFRLEQVPSDHFAPPLPVVQKQYMKRLEGKEDRVRMKLVEIKSGEKEELTMEDIDAALNTMDPTKIGQDGVPYAAWTLGGDAVKELIHEICNAVWMGDGVPETWKQVRILVVPNSELQRNIGIVTVHSMSLIYRKILGHKLLRDMDKKQILSPNQTGNRVGFSCLHNIYALNYLVGRELAKKGGKVVCFFAHLRNAFDLVDRKKMMNTLSEQRVDSILRRKIEELYEETIDTVTIQRGKSGNPFWATKGLVQGCPLSPRLFNIYLSDLDAYFKRKDIGGLELQSEKVFFVAYTNSITLLAKDESTMQKMMKQFQSYLEAKDLIVNTTKSEIMVFTMNENEPKVNFTWNKKTICQVNEVNHLGYTMSKNGTSELHVKKIMQKLNSKMKTLLARQLKMEQPFKKQMQAFDDVMGSHMYGVQIWGWKERTKLDALQVEYIRKIKKLSNKLSPDDVRKAGERKKMQALTGKRALKWESKLARHKPDSLAGKCLKEIQQRRDEILKTGQVDKNSLWEIERHNFLTTV